MRRGGGEREERGRGDGGEREGRREVGERKGRGREERGEREERKDHTLGYFILCYFAILEHLYIYCSDFESLLQHKEKRKA